MATRFEIVLPGENHVTLRAAGEEALDEIERIEGQLSLYRPSSEIAQVNAQAAEGPVRVSPSVFGLLKRCVDLSAKTGGAFDITVAPLVRCWGFMRGSGEMPSAEQIAEAKSLVGSAGLELDDANYTVRFRQRGMMIDLGSIGKGYAIDRAIEILRDSEIRNALVHGGTSTVFGMGIAPDGKPWKVSIDSPPKDDTGLAPVLPLTIVELHNKALSVSAVWGKSFSHNDKIYGHVIDPRTGWPTGYGRLAAAIAISSEESDALSTAALLTSDNELAALQTNHAAVHLMRA